MDVLNPGSTASMGTLAWGEGRSGALNGLEKVRLIGNLAFVQTREVIDSMRQGLGLLRTTRISFEELLPPDNSLVQDAMHLAEETHEQALLFHSWRTYIFGAMFATHERFAFDRSIFFAAAILHDIALTGGHSPRLCECCFALSGGRRVRDFLSNKGHPKDVSHKVGDAIALHLNGWVSKKRHGAEAHLVSRGAVCDLYGFGKRRIAEDSLRHVLSTYPRTKVIEALQFETANHREATRPAVMTRLAGQKAPPDPFAALDDGLAHRRAM